MKTCEKFKTLGEAIATFRKELQMTQADFAEKIGLNRVVVTKIELNQRAISLDEAKRISDAFGLSIDTLFDCVEEAQAEEKNDLFVLAFRAKGMNEEDLKEIQEVEFLIDALYMQELIYQGGE